MNETSSKENRHQDLFTVASDRLPVSLPVKALRWWLPGILCVLGTVLLVANGFDLFGASAFAAFVGAGSSIWLANVLWRIGVSGDDEREREAQDRVYLAKHGHWPDEEQ